ncbi:MAG: hypothetical protein ACUVSV_02200 [Armatimonadota bacterium]
MYRQRLPCELQERFNLLTHPLVRCAGRTGEPMRLYQTMMMVMA